MKKKLSILFLGLAILGLTSGCFKRDDMEDIQIYTTVYPITYIISQLYGNYAKIDSIYPNGVDINNYELTDKQITDYSKGNLFIYNGLSNEKEIARKLLNKNHDMKIIDVSYGLNAEYSTDSSEELWLSPNNFLMLATTTKDNLCDFISSTYIKEEINKNYKVMQEEVSLIDAELRSVGSSSAQKNKNTIVVSSNTFKFLENYGFKVISLEDEKNYTNELKNNFKNKTYQYVFIKDDDETDNVKDLKNNYGAKEVSINTLDVLTDDEVKNNENYVNIMKAFIKNISDVVL